MWMTDYIAEINRQFVSRYGLKSNVPDGVYPMLIEGKIDRVEIRNGKIHCANLDDQTWSFPRDVVISVVAPMSITDGPGVGNLIGYVLGDNPNEFMGGFYSRVEARNSAVNWLVQSFPELAAVRDMPHPSDVSAVETFVAGLGLPDTFAVPRRAGASDWLPVG